MDTQKLLTVNNVSFSYESEEVISKVSFEVHQKEILGILGPNGGGKSTLLKCIVGLLKPSHGSLTFWNNGKQTKRPPLVYIPQKDSMNISYPMTIEEILRGARIPEGTVSREESENALKKVGLEKAMDTKLGALSGGEFQRVLLGKAYLNNAQLVLMDEPTKGLDGVGQDKLLEIIHNFKEEKQAGIILVEHNIGQVLRHSDRLLCLNRNYHWHNHRDMIDKKILESTYHCEFEHLLIHENKGDILSHDHHQLHRNCSHHEDSNSDNENDKVKGEKKE